MTVSISVHNIVRVIIHPSCYLVSAPFFDSFFGPGTAETVWNNVGGCRGTESSIFDCSYTTPVICNGSCLAGVRCYGKDTAHAYACALLSC